MNGRPLQPGIEGTIAVITYPGGDRRRIAECACCERPRRIEGRGLCSGCREQARKDGTLSDWGWTRADRLAEYRQLPRHLTMRQAAEKLGVSVRTIQRYKAATGE